MSGAAALAALLRTHGVTTVFAYPGTSELILCAALTGQPGMHVINARGDAEAAFMAAGANLAHPGSAVSVLHGARGLTGALGTIADTRRSETAVLHLVGMASRHTAPFLPPHAEPNLIASAGAFATAAFDTSTVEGWDAEAFTATVHHALASFDALPGGPVLLGVPQDILEQPFIPTPLPAPPLRADRRDIYGDVTTARAWLATAERPVILVDDYLLLAGTDAETALGVLAARIGAPVLQVAYRRGPMLFGRLHPGRVPTFAGYYKPTIPEHQTLMARADLLITVEDRNMYPRVIGDLPLCRKIAITSNPTATQKNRYLAPSDLLLAGHPHAILAQLTPTLSYRSTMDRSTGLASLRAGGCRSAHALAVAIGAALCSIGRATLIDDSQMFGGLLAKHHNELPETIRIFGSHGGYVGSGLPTAIGAAHTATTPIICTLGDHGYTNGIKALAAIHSIRTPLAIIVCNNSTSTSLETEAQTAAALNDDQGLLRNHPAISYTAMAAGYGVTTETITWPPCGDQNTAIDTAAQHLIHTITTTIHTRQSRLVEIMTPNDHDLWNGIWKIA